ICSVVVANRHMRNPIHLCKGRLNFAPAKRRVSVEFVKWDEPVAHHLLNLPNRALHAPRHFVLVDEWLSVQFRKLWRLENGSVRFHLSQHSKSSKVGFSRIAAMRC